MEPFCARLDVPRANIPQRWGGNPVTLRSPPPGAAPSLRQLGICSSALRLHSGRCGPYNRAPPSAQPRRLPRGPPSAPPPSQRSALLGGARLCSALLGSSPLGGARLCSAHPCSALLCSALFVSARRRSAVLGSSLRGGARLCSAVLSSSLLGGARLAPPRPRASDLAAPHKAGRSPAEPTGGRAGPARPRPAAQASRLGRAGGAGADAAKPRRAEPRGRAAIPRRRRKGRAGPFPELRPWREPGARLRLRSSARGFVRICRRAAEPAGAFPWV